jgi:hypothetical protein
VYDVAVATGEKNIVADMFGRAQKIQPQGTIDVAHKGVFDASLAQILGYKPQTVRRRL